MISSLTEGLPRALVLGAALLLSATGAHGEDTHTARQGTGHDLVSRGAYLALAGDCVSCHTAPNGKPYAGGSYMPTPFGEISVPNITPDRQTGIGAWSDDEFYRALHEGIGRQGENLYPVFPFPWYTKVTRSDALAIKAYLFSLAPVSAARMPLKLSWPASQRVTLTAWRTLFFKAGEFQPNPQLSAEANRGAYLVEGLGHCGECHNQHNVTGASKWSGNLEGGQIEGWYAPNLTGDKNQGIGSWSTPELAGFLKKGIAPHGSVVLGPMQEVVTESLSHLSDPDLHAMASYLKSVPAKETFPQQRASEYVGEHSPGSGEYLTYCGSCHGVHGEGVSREISSLAKNGVVTAQGPEDVIRVVLGGLPATHGLAPMPAVGAVMTDQQVAATVDYVRNAFGNSAPGSAGSGLVASLRAKTATALAGNPAGGCPRPTDQQLSRELDAQKVSAKLAKVTDTNMLASIDALVPKLRALTPKPSDDSIVNALTDEYCATLATKDMTAAQRSVRLGNFSVLVYSQLKHPSHG